MVILSVLLSGESLLATQSSTQWKRARGTCGLLEGANPSAAFLSASSLRVLVSCNISGHSLKFFTIYFLHFELFVTGINPVASPMCSGFVSAFLAVVAYWPCVFFLTH